MTTNANNFKRREAVREECFIAIYDEKDRLKAVIKKDVFGTGDLQIFTTKRANYTLFLEILFMLSNLWKSCVHHPVQPVDKLGIAEHLVESVEVIPNLSTRS